MRSCRVAVLHRPAIAQSAVPDDDLWCLQVLNKARDDAGRYAQASLQDTNNVVRMVTAGSKVRWLALRIKFTYTIHKNLHNSQVLKTARIPIAEG